MRVGDDHCLRLIRDHLRTKLDLPPHIRYWLRYIAEEMAKRWRKVTEKWPEPWLQWQGAIEEGNGRAILEGERVVAVRYSLWQRPGVDPSEKHSWGGAVWPEDVTTVFAFVEDEFTIVLEDGRQGTAVAASTSDRVVRFLGQGPSPADSQA